MFRSLYLLLSVILLSSCTTTFYVVRHAEKEAATSNMTTDVPLSAAGTARAEALKELLKNKKIVRVYSTDYKRTKNTAMPLATELGVPITIYNEWQFLRTQLADKKGNTLIVGHSNTVDDIVNNLMMKNELKDLPDAQYGDLFILKRKGKKWSLKVSHFGN
jgi:2,3-bisphosphoglycerate-dependent phosphoglycerate mutase